jgi:hypothetical protein
MKKLFSVLVIAGMAALVACGPSAEELAAKAKVKADSLKAIATADSIKAVVTADSIAAADKAKQIADSIAAIPVKPEKGAKSGKK